MIVVKSQAAIAFSNAAVHHFLASQILLDKPSFRESFEVTTLANPRRRFLPMEAIWEN